MSTPLIQPVNESDAVDKVAQTFERIREVLELSEVPEIFRYFANVPALLHDYFMNFRKFVLSEGKLDLKTKLLVASAACGHMGCQAWLSFLKPYAERAGVNSTEVIEAMAVGSTNSMYNVLFKFRDISGSDVFDGMSVGLRAHTFSGTSLTHQTVELINLSLSNLNGCKPCTSSHVAKARQLEISDEAIYEAVQCAATIVCGSQFLRSVGVN
ncbi:MAG: carboxymuconolactone decarboxylase family protein [Planctomycetaceae bacterium]|nr:carboxymuconolactone decarboxylase family protein [Planctomycetaceae bacterium]